MVVVHSDEALAQPSNFFNGPGHFLFLVESVTDVPAEGKFKAECVALSGTDPAQTGKKITAFCHYGPEKKAGAKRYTLDFALALGLVSAADYERMRKNPGEIAFDEQMAVGRLFVANVEAVEEEDRTTGQKTGRIFHNLGWDIWHPLDPKAAAVPKDQTAMTTCHPHPFGNGRQAAPQSAAAPPVTHAPQPAPAPAGASGGAWGQFG